MQYTGLSLNWHFKLPFDVFSILLNLIMQVKLLLQKFKDYIYNQELRPV